MLCIVFKRVKEKKQGKVWMIFMISKRMLRTTAERDTKKSISKPISVKNSVKSTLKSIYREKKQPYALFDEDDLKEKGINEQKF